jgi:ribonuclease P protein component
LYASAVTVSASAWPPRVGAKSCRRAGDAAASGCPPDGDENRRAAFMERLRQRADFLAAASGIKVPATAFVLQARNRRDTGPARFGFTVSKKVGNAVERNRVRRRLREIVRLSAASRPQAGHDYVLVGRRAALNQPFAAMTQDFEGALRRAHARRSGKTE